MHQLVGSLPHHCLTDMAKKYGPIMHLQLGQLSQIVISSPEIAKEVMKTHDLIFASRPFVLAASIVAYNARDIGFAPYGDYWRQMKKICTLELLSAKRVKSFRTIREEEVSFLIRSIASTPSAPVNLSKMVVDLSYSVLSRTTIGTAGKQTSSFTPVALKIVRALGGFTIADLFPSVKLLQVITETRSKLENLHREADAILDEVIREHKERKDSKNKEEDDFVHVLLNIQDQGMLDIPLTTQDIKAVILDMFMAGSETSPTVIEWTMSELMKHPKILERTQIEVRSVFAGKEKIDETSLHHLTFLKAVIKEAMRLHVPAPLLVPREARQTVELCGYKIPEKTRIVVNAEAIGRDPRHWTEPERFYPERFLNCSIDYNGRHFEFIPFGAGRRMCPGALYGMLVVELVLANLLYHFYWKIPDGMKPEDLDMSETFGLTVRRKNDLLLCPIQYDPSQ